MHPFRVLGLPLDADVPAIKRAYAQLLRKHRPDVDPQGFQRIHEAYKACLQLANQRVATRPASPIPPQQAASSDEVSQPSNPIRTPKPDASTDSKAVLAVDMVAGSNGGIERPLDPVKTQSPDPEPAPAAERKPTRPPIPIIDANTPQPQQQPPAGPAIYPGAHLKAGRKQSPPPAFPRATFSLEEFVREVFRRDAERVEAMRAWLQGHEALYSLALKQSISAPLVLALTQHKERLRPEILAALLGFFNLDTVIPNNPRLGELTTELRRKTQAAWDFNQIATFQKSFGTGAGQRATLARSPNATGRLLQNELLKPFHFFRRLLIVLIPSLPIRTTAMLQRLRHLDADSAKERVNTGSATWWEQACNQRHLRWPRLCVAMSRILVVYAFASWVSVSASDALSVAFWFAGVWLAYVVAHIGWLRLGDWQKSHPRYQVRSLAILAFLGIGSAISVLEQPVAASYCFGTAIWLLVVDPPRRARKAALVAIGLGVSGLFSLIERLGYTPKSEILLPVILAIPCLIVFARDMIVAKLRRITIAQARLDTAWLAIISISWLLVIVLSGATSSQAT